MSEVKKYIPGIMAYVGLMISRGESAESILSQTKNMLMFMHGPSEHEKANIMQALRNGFAAQAASPDMKFDFSEIYK